MKKHGVVINNLYAVIGKQRKKYQRGENDVHYNDAGRDLLAVKVAGVIKASISGDASTDTSGGPKTSAGNGKKKRR